ncbi:MAG: GntR family transcriptional regulator [Nitrospirota bacterium]
MIDNYSVILDRQDHQKLYLQLYEIIKKKIEHNEWPVGSQIPTEEELCKMFNVSRATVRTAILHLVRQGYLRRQSGKGTFVSRRFMSYAMTMLTSFRELMLETGTPYSTKIYAQTVMMPIDDLSTKLNISADKHVIYIKRATIVNNRPVIFQEIYIPFHICRPLLEEDVESNSLVDLFKKYEINITQVKNLFDVAHLNAEQAKLFDLPENSPALLLDQYFLSGDIPLMYIRSVKRPDSVKFAFEFERGQAEPFVYKVSNGPKET